ncbi:hypothetical protein H072_4862 [Dactylellina haptotyla CBS 200.50]|uniref:Uncharacterized protein n=1 Tax=Dactylellina haptotyla (strain CBS 200.50) TaxID=1284197 RepID=S8BP92_DACHA|nr:hypothetical protein H072_4862 [Dactylellina haptotyla CBS 200.50]
MASLTVTAIALLALLSCACCYTNFNFNLNLSIQPAVVPRKQQRIISRSGKVGCITPSGAIQTSTSRSRIPRPIRHPQITMDSHNIEFETPKHPAWLQPDFNMSDFLNLTPTPAADRHGNGKTPGQPRTLRSQLAKRLETAKKAGRVQHPFVTPALKMPWTGNDENESPVEQAGLTIDPTLLQLEDDDIPEGIMTPLANVKARSKPFSERISDRSSKRQCSGGFSDSKRLPLHDLQSPLALEPTTPTEKQTNIGSEDDSVVFRSTHAIDASAITPKPTPANVSEITSEISTDEQADVDITPRPTKSALKTVSQTPAPASEIDSKTEQVPFSIKKKVSFSDEQKQHRRTASDPTSGPQQIIQNTPPQPPAEILTEEQELILQDPRFDEMPNSVAQLKLLLASTQDKLKAAQRALEAATQNEMFLQQEMSHYKNMKPLKTEEKKEEVRKEEVKRKPIATAPATRKPLVPSTRPHTSMGNRHHKLEPIGKVSANSRSGAATPNSLTKAPPRRR